MRLFVTAILFLCIQTVSVAGQPPADMACVFTDGSPVPVELSAEKACTAGKPRVRFLCVGSVKCTRPGFKPQYNVAVCAMPEDGCVAVNALACAREKSSAFKVLKDSDVDLDEARVYRRTIADEDRLQTIAKPAFRDSGLQHSTSSR